MANSLNVVRRDESDDNSFFHPSIFKLAAALLALVCVGLLLVGTLHILKRKRQARTRQSQSLLPTYQRSSTHRRLTITAPPYSSSKPQSIYVYNEKLDLLENSDSPPNSPVPEIRITFPDEEDTEGKRKSGKVVVVRISETGSVGMEPVREEHCPPYSSSDAERFQSLDLDRMGGLQEKETRTRHWS